MRYLMHSTIWRASKRAFLCVIEVYDQKFYRYADPNYSITELPLTKEDVRLIDKAVDLLAKAEGQPELQATGRVLKRVRKRLIAILNFG